jgi:hypothetical protein
LFEVAGYPSGSYSFIFVKPLLVTSVHMMFLSPFFWFKNFTLPLLLQNLDHLRIMECGYERHILN